MFCNVIFFFLALLPLSHCQHPGQINQLPKSQIQTNTRVTKNLLNFASVLSVTALSRKVSVAKDFSHGTFTAVQSPAMQSIVMGKETNDEDNSFIRGLASGAASRLSKEAILHPIDTVRARLSSPPELRNSSALFDDLYSGVVPALVGGLPAGAIFFGVKDFSKKKFRSMGFSKEQATLLSVTAANIPFWIIRTPTETIKTRQQVGETSVLETTTRLYREGGLQAVGEVLYSSYGSNFIYALPTDIIKFLAYETLSAKLYGTEDGAKVEGLAAAVTGALAGMIAQLSTSPLDVARTRIMSEQSLISTPAAATVSDGLTPGSTHSASSSINESASASACASGSGSSSSNPVQVMVRIAQTEGVGALFEGTLPRVVRALGSGAIQFTAYELTQNSFRK